MVSPTSNLPQVLPLVLVGPPAGAPGNVQLLKTSTFEWNVGIGTVQLLFLSTFRWNIKYTTIWTEIN